MSKYRSAGYRKSARGSKIRAWLHHKQMAALIPENKNVFRPKISPDAVVTKAHNLTTKTNKQQRHYET